MKILMGFAFIYLAFSTTQAPAYESINGFVKPPGPCQCAYAGKDYSKPGYYTARFSGPLFFKEYVESHYDCLYACVDKHGVKSTVRHEDYAMYKSDHSGGADMAQKWICPQTVSDWIRKSDEEGNTWYDAIPVGNFSANESVVPEVQTWSAQNCN